VVKVGLISDTHMPQRWPDLPPAVGKVFAGLDLILHAGDVGELWVLDALSRYAPVAAVHGNDDSPQAERELPERLVLAVGGRRILLWHSHFADREEELASRQDDRWERILQRGATHGRRAGAHLVVFGHTHVPMARRVDGVLLVNPGAIASGNYVTRQLRQTVAVLTVDDGAPTARHVDLAAPQEDFEASVDWESGFGAALARYQSSILAPELRGAFAGIKPEDFADVQAFIRAILPLAHACWAGKRESITAGALRQAMEGAVAREDWEMVWRRVGAS
jgi:uncharacterized protein